MVLPEGQKMDLTASQGSMQPCESLNKYLSKCYYIFAVERSCAFRKDYQPYFNIIFTNSLLWYSPKEIFTSFFTSEFPIETLNASKLCPILPLSGFDAELSGH